MKRKIRLSEGMINSIIRNSVRRVLNEDSNPKVYNEFTDKSYMNRKYEGLDKIYRIAVDALQKWDRTEGGYDGMEVILFLVRQLEEIKKIAYNSGASIDEEY